MHLILAARECDTFSADYVWSLEKQEEEVDEMIFGPAYPQLAATLYARMIGLITKESFRIVEMTGGHGCEA